MGRASGSRTPAWWRVEGARMPQVAAVHQVGARVRALRRRSLEHVLLRVAGLARDHREHQRIGRDPLLRSLVHRHALEVGQQRARPLGTKALLERLPLLVRRARSGFEDRRPRKRLHRIHATRLGDENR